MRGLKRKARGRNTIAHDRRRTFPPACRPPASPDRDPTPPLARERAAPGLLQQSERLSWHPRAKSLRRSPWPSQWSRCAACPSRSAVRCAHDFQSRGRLDNVADLQRLVNITRFKWAACGQHSSSPARSPAIRLAICADCGARWCVLRWPASGAARTSQPLHGLACWLPGPLANLSGLGREHAIPTPSPLVTCLAHCPALRLQASP